MTYMNDMNAPYEAFHSHNSWPYWLLLNLTENVWKLVWWMRQHQAVCGTTANSIGDQRSPKLCERRQSCPAHAVAARSAGHDCRRVGPDHFSSAITLYDIAVSFGGTREQRNAQVGHSSQHYGISSTKWPLEAGTFMKCWLGTWRAALERIRVSFVL